MRPCYSRNCCSASPLAVILLLNSLTWAVGCSQLTTLLNSVDGGKSAFAEQERKREEYQATHSAESIRWLLANGLRNGMSKRDVDRLIGEEGEREFSDGKILGQGGLYRSDDTVYRWGPDRDGHAYLFVFRDDHLINVENFAEDLGNRRQPRLGASMSSDDF